MSLLWLLFISLAVVGSVAYSSGMKLGGHAGMNPFGYAVVLSVVVFTFELLSCLAAKFVFKVNVWEGVNPQTVKFAVLTGAGAAMVDICFFLALRNGSVIASQTFWNVGIVVAMAALSVLVWGETVSPLKALGIAMGIASVVLIAKAP